MSSESSSEKTGQTPVLIESFGPPPFVTRRHYFHEGEQKVWRSRDHRRGLRRTFRPAATRHWEPEKLNPWIGSSFAIGSSLFVAGSVLSLSSNMARALNLSNAEVNLIFFLGSIFFTAAAYTQLFQAANANPTPEQVKSKSPMALFGWRPDEIGWLSCFLQFLGTLLFNLNTFAAVGALGSWVQQDLTIWVPDAVGSVLFLVSGYLAFIETCHCYWAWKPKAPSWWVVSVNLLGCIAFMISAIFAFVPPGGADSVFVSVSLAWTLLGAVAFFTGSILLLAEDSANDRLT